MRRLTEPTWVVILLLLVIVGPFVQPLTAQPAPRVAATAALVDDGELAIDGYPLGVDFAPHDGRIYSDKAPGQEILSIPVYVAARMVGAEPARVPRVDENLTLWWMAFTSAFVPLLAIVAMMGVALRRRGLDAGVPVLAAMAFGTMLLPFSSNLYGHVLATALAFGSWLVLDGHDHRAGRSWWGGLLAGAAVTTEYQLAIVAALLGGWVLYRRGWRQGFRFAGGSLPCAVMLAAYQTLIFGAPLSSGYDGKGGGESGVLATHTQLPSPIQALEVLFGTKGILVFTPVVALALVGMVRRWSGCRDDAAPLGLVIFAAYLALQASWGQAAGGAWGGEMPGPRFLVPALPFLAVGLADVWGRVSPLMRRTCAAVSVISMGLATGVMHLVPEDAVLVTSQLERLRRNGPVPTLFTVAVGPMGWVVHLVLVGTLILVLWQIQRPGTRGGTTLGDGGRTVVPEPSDSPPVAPQILSPTDR